jgi:seryl-tRNA synthetase
VIPPLIVRDEALYGTGNLPKFEEDLFFTPHTTGGLGSSPHPKCR